MIGIISQKEPQGNVSNCIWFNEIEAVYAYLLHQNLTQIIVDKEWQYEGQFLLNKYIELIKQMRPDIKIDYKLLKNNNLEQVDKILHYPMLEVLFKNGLLKSVYQPIVKTYNNKCVIVGVECLSRLYYKEHDYPPEILFSYAQEKLKMKDYDQLCIWQALRSLKAKDDWLIFLNVRPPTLMDNNFIHWLKNILKDINQKPENIVLEITEQYCVFSVAELLVRTNILRREGFKIAIDDFGVGMSNFSLLLGLIPDYLKICGSLINGVSKDQNKAAIVGNMLNLACKLKIDAIVESVEDKNDWQKLLSLGANFAQGYYFCRPQEDINLVAI